MLEQKIEALTAAILGLTQALTTAAAGQTPKPAKASKTEPANPTPPAQPIVPASTPTPPAQPTIDLLTGMPESPAQPTKTYTVQEVTTKVQEGCLKIGRTGVIEALKACGAESVPTLKAEKYGEAVSLLTAMIDITADTKAQVPLSQADSLSIIKKLAYPAIG